MILTFSDGGTQRGLILFIFTTTMWPSDVVDRAATATGVDAAPAPQMHDFEKADEAAGGVASPPDVSSPVDVKTQDDTTKVPSDGIKVPDAEVKAPVVDVTDDSGEETESLATDDALDQGSDDSVSETTEEPTSDESHSQTEESQATAESDDIKDLQFVRASTLDSELEADAKQELDLDAVAEDLTMPIDAPYKEAEAPVYSQDSGAQLGQAAIIGAAMANTASDQPEENEAMEDVAVDDAVPVNDIEAPSQQKNANKSVCSEGGTETDESVSIGDGGASTITKHSQDPSEFCSPRHIRIYVFSLVVLALVAGAAVALLFGMGLIGGRSSVTASPTSSPTASPTPAPTVPLVSVADTATSDPPTAAPTAAPTADPLLNLLKFVSGDRLDDTESPQYKAFEWMKRDDPVMNDVVDTDVNPVRVYQRYAMVTLYAALTGEVPEYASQDECDWPTVICGTQYVVQSLGKTEDWQVSELNLARQSLKGSIPPEIAILAPSLIHLDMAENPKLTGSIPNEVYELTRLKNLYLHNSGLVGTLSEQIGNMELLENLFLGNNKLSGSIPENLGSPKQGAKVLRKVSLHHNMFNGSIPENLNLGEATYVDLSFNNISGALPQNPSQDFPSVRHLYLDHNNFTGTIPESYSTTTLTGLVTLSLNDNSLSGTLPTSWVDDEQKDATSTINTINVENNSLTDGIWGDVCRLSPADRNGGMLVELSADCDVCWCDEFCDHCWNRVM